MPTITQGAACAVTVTLQRNGSPVSLPDSAIVRAQFYGPDVETPVSPELIALATDEFAAWHQGVVALHLTEADTAHLARPISLLHIWASVNGAEEEWWLRFTIVDPADLRGSPLFPDRAQAVEALRQMMKLGGGLLSGLCSLPSESLWAVLVAAEADAERALRVYFGPVEVLPETASPAERDALDAAGTRWVEEPAYDLDDEAWMGDRWGYLPLRKAPVQAVHGMQFIYPLPFGKVFDVPSDWIRVDKRAGHIRLVPGTQAFAAPLAVGMMQAIGGGRTIPHFIHVRYRTGLDPRQYPDLIDLVRRMAALRLLQGMFLPASGSISADGLSESTSVDTGKFADEIAAATSRLKQAIHGIQCAFL